MKPIGPVGVMAVPREVSLTIAVQEVAWFTTTELGEHARVTEVVRRVTVREKRPKLRLWAVSPVYVALTVWVPVPSAVGR